MADPGGPVAGVAVVVPAHDEEQLIGACLAALDRAVAALAATRASVPVATVVVLDRCSDGTADVAAHAGVPTLVVDAGSVGVARATGVRSTVARLGPLPPAQVWVACTDADSRVPEDWLVAQLDAAAAGASLVVGAVRPDTRDLDPATFAAWQARHRAGSDVAHGANLGFRLDAYERAGGFPALAEHEDVLLVRELRRLGAVEGPSPAVATSGRRVGRTPGGFAGYLRSLSRRRGGPGTMTR